MPNENRIYYYPYEIKKIAQKCIKSLNFINTIDCSDKESKILVNIQQLTFLFKRFDTTLLDFNKLFTCKQGYMKTIDAKYLLDIYTLQLPCNNKKLLKLKCVLDYQDSIKAIHQYSLVDNDFVGYLYPCDKFNMEYIISIRNYLLLNDVAKQLYTKTRFCNEPSKIEAYKCIYDSILLIDKKIQLIEFKDFYSFLHSDI